MPHSGETIVRSSVEGDCLLVDIYGSLTYKSVRMLDAEVVASDPAVRHVVIDCAALTNIDKIGCGQLVVIRRALGPTGSLRLRNPSKEVRDTLDCLQFTHGIVEFE